MKRLPGLLATVICGAFALAGCSNDRFPTLTTAASMRVEVEVFKGPTTNSPEIQWAELVGALDEIDATFRIMPARKEMEIGLIRRRNAEADEAMIERIFADFIGLGAQIGSARARAKYFNDRFYANHSDSKSNIEWAEIDIRRRSVASLLAADVGVLKQDHCGKTSDQKSVHSPDFLAVSPAAAETNVDAILSQTRNALLWIEECQFFLGKQIDQLKSKIASEKNESERKRSNEDLAKAESKHTAISKLVTEARQLAAFAEQRSAAMRSARPLTGDLGTTRSLGTAESIRAEVRDILVATSVAARTMKLRATSWSGTQIGTRFATFEARQALASLTTLVATQADLIGARADTLLRQVRGDDRRELPLSVMLRETSPPAFLRQFVWNEAAGGLDGFGAVSAETARDRVRAFERIYTDQHWSNINTVFASGEGTIRMALIKDDIGNWNLKSFDQDPSEILAANTRVGLAALDAALQVAKTASTVGGAAAATEAMSIARIATGGAASSAAPTIAGQTLVQLRQDLIERLAKLHAETSDELRRLDSILGEEGKPSPGYRNYLDLAQKLNDAVTAEANAKNNILKKSDQKEVIDAYSDARTKREDAEAAFKPLRIVFDTAKERKTGLIAATRLRVHEMLTAHEAVVDALDRAAAASDAPPPRPAAPLPNSPAPRR